MRADSEVSMNRWRPVAALLLLFAANVLADPPGVVAITGGTVHPGSAPEIANGTVIIRDGLIEAVGASLPVPADATVVDATGMHVYPALIDALSTLGFPAPKPETKEPGPDANAARSLALSDADLEALRAAGFATIITAPSQGIFNGQAAAINLGNDSSRRVVRASVAQRVSFNTRPSWTFPDSLMGVVAFIRQTFIDASQQNESVAIYRRDPAGRKRPDDNPDLDALVPSLRREQPVVFVADTELLLRRSLAIAKEFGLRPVLASARQAYRFAPELKDIPVLVSVRWPKAPATDPAEQSLREIRDRQLAPTTPAALAKAGVRFALVSNGAKPSEIAADVRKAVKLGLSADDALRALTVNPATIFGLERQLGSLERGKIANVLITDLPLFEEKARVKHLFVDGHDFRIVPTAAKGEKSANAIDGSWDLSVSAAESISIRAELKLEDGRVTGTFSGDRGTGNIAGGSFDGETLEFTISARVAAETSDWVFRGRVRDDAIDGTVTTNAGSFAFSGRRSL
jgi:hypothetical protein